MTQEIRTLPKGWKLVRHEHSNCGEGLGVPPYQIEVYEDQNGKQIEINLGSFESTPDELERARADYFIKINN